MDLNEQAEQAVNRVFEQAETEPPHVHAHERIVARMIWLDGYKAGMNATKALADDNFARLRAELS